MRNAVDLGVVCLDGWRFSIHSGALHHVNHDKDKELVREDFRADGWHYKEGALAREAAVLCGADSLGNYILTI